MTKQERERMNALCDEIAQEKNHDRFLRLMRELNDLLERKEQRLENSDPSK